MSERQDPTFLPVPAFATVEEQIKGAKAMTNAGDTTTQKVADAVPLGELLVDNDLMHVRYLKKEGDLLYHIFRGKAVPQEFWGEGDYGLKVLEAAEQAWPTDKVLVEFLHESVRQEAVEDDPTKPPKYPPHFYGAYLVTVPQVDSRPLPPDEERFMRLPRALIDLLGAVAS